MSVDALPDPVFLGYVAKKPWMPALHRTPAFPTDVLEVCSVSRCLAEPPPDWVHRWDFNRATCHGAPEAAVAGVPSEERSSYSVFAYWLVPAGDRPVSAIIDEAFDSRLPELPDHEGPTDYEPLGFDVVNLTASLMGFGCSPLSCNGLAAEERVNRHCLIDERDRALALAVRWSVPGSGHEPGTYYVVMVAREPRRHDGG